MYIYLYTFYYSKPKDTNVIFTENEIKKNITKHVMTATTEDIRHNAFYFKRIRNGRVSTMLGSRGLMFESITPFKQFVPKLT